MDLQVLLADLDQEVVPLAEDALGAHDVAGQHLDAPRLVRDARDPGAQAEVLEHRAATRHELAGLVEGAAASPSGWRAARGGCPPSAGRRRRRRCIRSQRSIASSTGVGPKTAAAA